jgi:aspartyl-tRNA(Asn)/glutamyl-tRNA(Gln) amidotransferase subunit A
LKRAGADIIHIDLTLQSLWVPCYYLVACAEASSNLSRYDGLRFGYRAPHADNSSIRELITLSRSQGFGAEVKRRILLGTHILSSGYFESHYLHALKMRRLIQEELLQNLSQVDLIMGPTTPSVAFPLGEKNSNPTQNYLADVFTVAANLAGLPAISIPAGFDGHLPIGLQCMAKPFNEALLFQVAHQYQTLTNWHLKTPFNQAQSI